MVRRTAPLLLSILGSLAVLPAHGGQYRGPGWPVAGPPPTLGGGGGPTTGGPGGPSAPAPTGGGATTGGRSLSPDSTNWQTWWEFNKDSFLELRAAIHEVAVTGSDDFYLGSRRSSPPIDLLAPTEVDLCERVVPALAGLLGRERNRDIQSACLVALGKIGRDAPAVDLEKTLSGSIVRDDQEVRETAVLSLGIAGRSRAMATLSALLRDQPEGRRLIDRAEVGDRTRAYAAWSLGQLAWRSKDGAERQTVHDLLLPLLKNPDEKSRDVRVAAVNGLGLLAADPAASSSRRLAWRTVEELLVWFEADIGRGDEVVQAHAPIAVARLLGRGVSPLHQRCKQLFAATLAATKRRSNPILQSAAIALGMLAEPAEREAEDVPFSAVLTDFFEKGHDRQARYFALISLGRIGGAANRDWLLRAYQRTNQAPDRPWMAIAVGIVADQTARHGETDATSARMLMEDLEEQKNDDTRAAIAVALGLTRHASASPLLLRLLLDHEGDERMAGYFCVSLALLGDRSSTSSLADVIERSRRRPFLLQQAAVALGRLGDKDASIRLVQMMKEAESTAVLSALAIAVGQIGDRRSIEPLLTILADEDQTKLARAFVAAALGSIGDKDLLPWNVPLSRDCNYAAQVDTLTNGATGVLDIL